MSLGSLLVGIAAALVTVAYVARPFRRTGGDWDRVVEQWVARLAPEAPGEAPSPVEPVAAPVARVADELQSEPVNFCPYCGRRVAADHRFCPGCGKPLPEREVAE